MGGVEGRERRSCERRKSWGGGGGRGREGCVGSGLLLLEGIQGSFV